MGDFGRETFVMHKKKVNFPNVVDEKFLQAVGKEVASLKLDVGNGAIEFEKSISKPFCYFHNRSRGLESILSLSTI